MKTRTRSSCERPGHVVDDSMGRRWKFKDDVKWMGALSGGSFWRCREGMDELNIMR